MNSWESRKSSYSERGERDREGKTANVGKRKALEHKDVSVRKDGRERDRPPHANGDDGWDITREIGWLTAHASEDWVRVLDLCERAKESDVTAKEAAKALRKDIKYGEPPAQVSAARLWAILLRNCGEPFVSLCASKKFMDAVEIILTKENPHPVVTERLKHVLASAAYTWPSAGVELDGKRGGFVGLWRKVRPKDAPEEGYPFDDSDPMFNPPSTPSHLLPSTQPEPQRASLPVPLARTASGQNLPSLALPTPSAYAQPRLAQRKSARVISPEEDRRRLLEECDIAKSNATLLREALVYAKPEGLEENALIQEFWQKCFKSQEIIASQLEWAAAQAQRSRELIQQQQGLSSPPPSNIIISPASPSSAGSLPTPPFAIPNGQRTPSPPSQRPLPVPPAGAAGVREKETKEEQLFAALLGAHQELLEVFKIYEEHARVGVEDTEEREVEERSKREVRMDRRDLQYLNAEGYLDTRFGASGGSSSQVATPSPSQPGSRSASPINAGYAGSTGHLSHPLPTPPVPHLAPPPHAPSGPRRRTPSPEGTPRRKSTDSFAPSIGAAVAAVSATVAAAVAPTTPVAAPIPGKPNGLRLEPAYYLVNGSAPPTDDESSSVPNTPVKPSAKALGKRPVKPLEEDDDNPFDPDDLFKEQGTPRPLPNEEEEEEAGYDPIKIQLGLWKPVKYAYDAAAEREAERRRMQLREVTTY
ncbi:hypothetical protein DACRYDRAFT_117303 [Dacryopinax primogenitus]|uniref:VHS domain-containing protein n=1 Tax=Dacryopinax primogenitus (strain DJM 731) TaxID=1858805 RepID=M5FX17_DACPD|nr:uncharacterized protein DACRYDRAFT_117303 [Dacryopinax primogenitus]EJU00250.1 hypothetical protein DACRYDRAFT_117303 [Dacryopinax primogenitus]